MGRFGFLVLCHALCSTVPNRIAKMSYLGKFGVYGLEAGPCR